MIRATIDCAVVAEPEVRFSNSGKAWVRIRAVSSERKRDEQGQWVDGDKTFFDILAFGKPAEMVAESELPKGCRLLVQGNLKNEKWTTDSGEDRWTLKVYADQIAVEMRFAPVRITSSSGVRPEPGPQHTDEPPF